MAFDVLSFVMGQKAAKSGGSSGGGGGALEPGGYWKVNEPWAPYAYSNTWFNFNGKLHCCCKTASSSDTYSIYEVTENEYKAVVTGITIMYGGGCPIGYNGKIHFFGVGNHYVLNGTTVTNLNKVTDGDNAYYIDVQNQLCNHNGILYAYNSNTGRLYHWNEADDTWQSEVIASALTGSNYIFFYNDELYCYGKGKLYKHVGTAWEEQCQICQSYDTATCVINNRLYVYGTSDYSVYVCNLDTKETARIGYLPFTKSQFIEYNGKLAAGNSSPKKMLVTMHEIE